MIISQKESPKHPQVANQSINRMGKKNINMHKQFRENNQNKKKNKGSRRFQVTF